MDNIIHILASELGRKPEQIEAVVTLLDEGNTIPFIARYRKELHGSMDDTALRALETRLQYLRNLPERQETVLAAIEAQEKLIRVFHGVYGPTLANVWNGQKYALQQLGVIASPLTLAQEMDGLTSEVRARIEACVREYRDELD